MRLSKSAILKYLACPADFKYDYILDFRHQREAPGEDSALTKGTRIHQIFEDFYKSPLLETLEEPYYDNILEILYTLENAHKYENHMENFAEFNTHQIKTKGIDNWMPLDLEMEVFDKELRFLGFIDRVDLEETGLRVIDYKSSKKDKPVKHYLLELALYALVYERLTGNKVYDAGIYFSNTGKLRTTPITEEDKEKAMQTIFNVREAIKMKHFPPKSNYFCRFCDNQNICTTDVEASF